MNQIAVIDYGMGNLHSVAKAIEHVGGNDVRLCVTSDRQSILSADRVVFPGVGAIRDCMEEIRRLEIDGIIHELAGKKPLLAICVGMQALMEHSEENEGVQCIGLFSGSVRRFARPLLDENGQNLKVPHMGWNTVHQHKDHPLWRGIPDGSRFYFVHSFHVVPAEDKDITGVSAYSYPFTSALARDNIFAVQFHPEKSQECGLQLLRNFIKW